MIRIGVAGYDEQSAEHLRVLATLPAYKVTGIWAPHTPEAEIWCKNRGLPCFEKFEDLLQQVDVIDLASARWDHFSLAVKTIKRSKALFIDTPFFTDPSQVLELIELSKEAGVMVHVHYPERYNPAYQASLPYLRKPLYIETRRHLALSGKNRPASPDMTELMIHDIDIILRIVKANIRTVRATAVNVFNGSPDIVNAHLEFDNGAVASLTTNRIASKNIHRMKFYQHKGHIQADFLNHRIKILREENSRLSDKFSEHHLHPPAGNKLRRSLSSFYKQLTRDKTPVSELDHTYQNLKTAWLINEKIEMLTS